MLLYNINIFGPTTDVFDSSGWEDPTDDRCNAHFLLFFPGKRNCQGQALANLELHIIANKMMQRYNNLELIEEGEPSYMVTLKPKGFTIMLTKKLGTDYCNGIITSSYVIYYFFQ